ncbi:hypothetical protein KKD03_02770 [Patescibacteria group bacterium]|nr:hypothetical protein [Patescibacteria group bacterium]
MTIKDKNVRIFLAVIFALVILVSIYFLIDNSHYKKDLVNKTVIEVPTVEKTYFPLLEDGLSTFNFFCNVTEVIYPNFQTIDNKIVEVGVNCRYLDVNNKEQNIKIPLVINDPNNNVRLAGTRYLSGDYSRWTPQDLLHLLEIGYYHDIGQYTDNYVAPKENNYWQKNTKKPTLDAGDDVTVGFNLENSELYTFAYWSNQANFQKSYHTNIYGYKNIAEFIQTGNPKLLDNEPDNWIIPLWAKLISDNNPL